MPGLFGGKKAKTAKVKQAEHKYAENKQGENEQEAKFAPGLPMAIHYQAIVNDLNNQINQSKPEALILKKYGIKRYYLENIDKEPVDVLIYSKESKPYPVLETQALKRVSSLIRATAALLAQEGRNEKAQLDQTLEDFQNNLKTIYKMELNNDEDFNTNFKKVNRLVQDLMDRMAGIWAVNHPFREVLKKRDYVAFFGALREMVEQVVPGYKHNQILTINENINSVHYCERGATAANGKKEFRSSHNRAEAGLANLAIIIAGHKNKEGALVLSNPGNFSHAVPVGFGHFAREKMQKKPSGYYSPESISIGSNNMLQLEQEIRSRMEVLQPGQKTGKTTLINVGLLTLSKDKEDQKRIYLENIKAADRLRGREGSPFNPITFDFGVNFFAISRTGLKQLQTYPDEQNFENQRAFFQLQRKTLESLERADLAISQEEKEGGESNSLIRELISSYKYLQDPLQAMEDIEEKIKAVARQFDLALNDFEADGSEANREKVQKLESELDKIKKSEWGNANKYFNQYNALYKKLEPAIKGMLRCLEDAYIEAKTKQARGEELDAATQLELSPARRSLFSVLRDFGQSLELYCKDTWWLNKNNFELQASIAHLGEHLGAIDHYYPEADGSISLTASSYNCKSRNDRSSVLAVILDLRRAYLDNPTSILFQRDKKGNLTPEAIQARETFAISAATAQIAIIDTDGGAPKFGGHIYDPRGHTAPDYSALEAETAKWSTKKLFAHVIEHLLSTKGAYKPYEGLTAPRSPRLKEAKDEDYGPLADLSDLYDKQFKYFDTNTNEQAQAFKVKIFSNASLDKEKFIAEVISKFSLEESKMDLKQAVALRQGLRKFTQAVEQQINRAPPQAKAAYNGEFAKDTNTAYSQAQLDQETDKVSEQVKSLAGWEKAINRKLFTISRKAKHFYNPNSSNTHAVKKAYELWELAQVSPNPLTHFQALSNLKNCVQAWIGDPKKNADSQFDKEGNLYEGSRLPAMRALLQHIDNVLPEICHAVYNGFQEETLGRQQEKLDL